MRQIQSDPGGNFLRGLAGGMQTGQNMRQAHDQNALRQILATQDINDPSVQQSIMGLDPQTGMQLQNQTYQRNRQSQLDARAAEDRKYQRGRDAKSDERVAADREYQRSRQSQLDERTEENQAYQRSRNAKSDAQSDELFQLKLQEHVASMSADERAREAEVLRKGIAGAIYSWENGDLDGINQILTAAGSEPISSLEEFPALAAQYKGVLGALESVRDFNAPAKPNYEVKDGQYFDKNNPSAGAQPIPGFKPRENGPLVENNIGGGDKLYETLDKAQGDMFGALIENAMNAPSKIAMIDQMERYLGDANTPEGFAAAAKTFAGEFGIKTEGLDVLQATQAIINKLVPEQRQPGSGPMSDADLALFKQSLPRLINTRDGNLMITRTLRGIAKYEQAQGRIASALANREITPADARRALGELENPLEVFRGGGETTIGGGIDPETQAIINRYSQ